ncbi:ATP-dependent nuclease [Streptomyces sp. cmx-4-9]|uniref:ATP-dependent nuclease n=1 Tax=Streptomyces sp. cmx-4-9 TaxID=2790941 RepID=UPI0039801ACF
MAVTFAVAEINLTGDVTIHPPKNGMTLFIGPNNSGKSLLLHELAPFVTSPGMVASNPHWVRTARSEAEGSGKEFLAWLKERGHRSWQPASDSAVQYRTGTGAALPLDMLSQWWEHGRWDQFSGLLTQAQWTDDRLRVEAQDSLWDFLEPGHSPVQHLFEDRDAERQFSDLMQQAFAEPVVVDRYGPSITLRVGDPQVAEGAPPPAPEVVSAFRRLPTVESQGDGFKSFAQLLLHTMVRPAPVVIIDEPEAFLHPPQARLLGRLLASMPGPSQVFVATHSADFLAGVLDAEADRELALVRLDRSGTPTARVLEPGTVRELLRTPLLRYSNIISGLFHDRVVLCESEGDCQFYAAAFDATKDPAKPENTLFLHTNGKPRLTATADRLQQCGIPTAVIADLDFLRNSVDVRNAVTTLRGSWEDVSSDVKTLNDQANQSRTTLTVAEFRKQMNEAIGRASEGNPLPAAAASRIGDLVKASSGWKHLKKAGLSALNGTNAHGAATRLINALAKLGVFLVPVGELECWVPSISASNKLAWLETVFAQGHHLSPDPQLTSFCVQIRKHLGTWTEA